MVHKQMEEMDINHNNMDIKNMMDKKMVDKENIVMVDDKAKKYDAIVKAIVEEEKGELIFLQILEHNVFIKCLQLQASTVSSSNKDA